MSRTDKDLPGWVAAMHAAWAGEHTVIRHGNNCIDRVTHSGAGPYGYERALMALDDVDEFIASHPGAVLVWDNTVSASVRVPVEPHPCDVDTAGGNCDRLHFPTEPPWCGCCCPWDGCPPRGADKQNLRQAVRAINSGIDPFDVDYDTGAPRRPRNRFLRRIGRGGSQSWLRD